MAKIRDFAVTIEAAAVTSMVCEMPIHESGDLLLAFVNKDSALNFNTPAGWVPLQTQTSAGAGGGVYGKRATSSSETVTFTYSNETAMAIIVSIRDVYGSTVADAVPDSNKTSSDDSTLPLSSGAIAATYGNCLILSALSTDSGIGPSALPGWVNIYGGDTGANSLAVAFTHKINAGIYNGANFWAEAVDDSRGFIIAVRDSGSLVTRDAYIAPNTTPSYLLNPLVASTIAVEQGSWIAGTSIVLTSVAGKTVTGVTVAPATDTGNNPFRASATTAGTSSKTNLAHTEFSPTTAYDLTVGIGVIFGTWLFTGGRDYLDVSLPSRGGVYWLCADASNDYAAWTIGAQGAISTSANARNNFVIQPGQSIDTTFGSSGSIDLSAISRFAIGSAGYYGACSTRWSELYLLNEVVLAGGTSTNPFRFDELVRVVNQGSGGLPLIQQYGSAATCWTPLRFGGIDPIHVSINLRTFQYPKAADGDDYLDFHVDPNVMGFEFYGLSGDTIQFTNCVFTSDSPYYWRFNSLHDSSSNTDFSGTSVVGATVSLCSSLTLNNVTFINCPSLTQNSAELTNCTISDTKVTSSSLEDISFISNSSFVSSGIGHAIEVSGTADTITLTGNTFTGYASGNGSTGNEAIYVNISSGTVTINISGGNTPSIRSAGATVIVNNSATLQLTNIISGSDIVILIAGTTTERVNIDANSGSTYDFSYNYVALDFVDICVYKQGYIPFAIRNYMLPISGGSLPINQVADRNFSA